MIWFAEEKNPKISFLDTLKKLSSSTLDFLW